LCPVLSCRCARAGGPPPSPQVPPSQRLASQESQPPDFFAPLLCPGKYPRSPSQALARLGVAFLRQRGRCGSQGYAETGPGDRKSKDRKGLVFSSPFRRVLSVSPWHRSSYVFSRTYAAHPPLPPSLDAARKTGSSSAVSSGYPCVRGKKGKGGRRERVAREG